MLISSFVGKPDEQGSGEDETVVEPEQGNG